MNCEYLNFGINWSFRVPLKPEKKKKTHSIPLLLFWRIRQVRPLPVALLTSGRRESSSACQTSLKLSGQEEDVPGGGDTAAA